MNNLRLLRKEHGLSLKALGKIIGVAESTLSLYETGKRQPDQNILISLAEFFGVSIDYLLGRTKNKSSLQMPELTDEDDGLIFSINGTNEKINLTSEQIQRAKELLKIAMPEQFNKDSGDKL